MLPWSRAQAADVKGHGLLSEPAATADAHVDKAYRDGFPDGQGDESGVALPEQIGEYMR